MTGGARRIGKAIVEDLASHGFAVAIHCNKARAEADSLAGQLRDAGGRAEVVQADLTDAASVETLIAAASEAIGPIDTLVNNASIFRDDSVETFDPRVSALHFAIHVHAPASLAKTFAAALPDGREGLVVNIIDQRVWKPNPRYFSYTLSKSALWTATQTMAQALAPRIRVNAIGPGPTFANASQRRDDFQAQIDGLILERGPALAEFGATIRYLWEARSVTGQMIALDGGQHLAWQTPDVTGIGGMTAPQQISRPAPNRRRTPPTDDVAGYHARRRGRRGRRGSQRTANPFRTVRHRPAVHGDRLDARMQATPTARSAPEVIQTLVKRLPNAPGVYRMMNAAGDVLYVGKARSLKKRVTNYAQGRFHTNRIGRMVRETATMEFVVDPHRDRGAPARSEPDQAACGRASTCCCATTSRSPTS